MVGSLQESKPGERKGVVGRGREIGRKGQLQDLECGREWEELEARPWGGQRDAIEGVVRELAPPPHREKEWKGIE